MAYQIVEKEKNEQLEIEPEPAVPDAEPPVAGVDDEAGPELTEDKVDLTGYACEFVTPPPSVLQVECPICLQVLREPHLITYCGHKFCKACIGRVVYASKPCPICNVADYLVVPDKSLHRTLNGLEVYCSRKNDGCEWVGELRSLDDHLNIRPESEEKRRDGCKFVVLKCTFCQQCSLRKTLKEHEEDTCKKRPYSCDYCNDYMATFEEVVVAHYDQCKCYPMPCPNKCDSPYAIERQNLDKHIADDCPLTVISCEAGCDVQVKREDMPAHLSENPVKHISYLASKVKEQENTIVALQQKHTMHTMHIQSMCSNLVPPCLFKFSEMMLRNDVWTSKPFYTHPGGYKLCLKVCPRIDFGEGSGTHARIEIHLLRGELDQYLEWPLYAFVTVEILNMVYISETGYHHNSLSFLCKSPQVAENDVDESKMMTEELIPLKTVRKYISNGKLVLRVSKVEPISFQF